MTVRVRMLELLHEIKGIRPPTSPAVIREPAKAQYSLVKDASWTEPLLKKRRESKRGTVLGRDGMGNIPKDGTAI